jgi:phosphate transport system protein
MDFSVNDTSSRQVGKPSSPGDDQPRVAKFGGGGVGGGGVPGHIGPQPLQRAWGVAAQVGEQDVGHRGDALYREIEQLVSREILLQAPVASDLRFLLSVLRIVPELERSHDLVIQIAYRAKHSLSDDLSPRTRALVERMGELAAHMWRQAADAWYQRDRSAVFQLEERDEELDELHASLIAELASCGMGVPVVMEMALVARDYERLGAHAVNIARRVVYLAGSAGVPPAP